jgi:type III pantothenate kinase
LDLAIDIGNTETTLGLFERDELRARWRISSDASRTPDEVGVVLRRLVRDGGFDPAAIRRASYASVAPAVSLVVAAACARALDIDPLGIDSGSPLPIRVDVDEPATVGPDRLANSVAGHLLHGGDLVVVDLGTATTFDCVTAEGAFVGGAIAPGVRTGADRLFERAARLPRVAITPPDRVIGRRTDECLRSGIFFGAVDALDGMVARIREEWGRAGARVIATGGLSALVGPHARTVDAIEPHLTLRGIVLIRRHMERVAPPARGSRTEGGAG